MREFLVRGLGADALEYTFCAVLGDYKLPGEAPGQHIEPQRWLTVPEGEEDGHVIVDESQATEENPAARWGLRDRVLVIELNEQGRRVFEDDGWRLDLGELTDAQVAEVERWMERVLFNVPRDDALARAIR